MRPFRCCFCSCHVVFLASEVPVCSLSVQFHAGTVGTHGGECPRNTAPVVVASGVCHVQSSRCVSERRRLRHRCFCRVLPLGFFVVAVAVATASPSVSADAVVVDISLLGSL